MFDVLAICDTGTPAFGTKTLLWIVSDPVCSCHHHKHTATSILVCIPRSNHLRRWGQACTQLYCVDLLSQHWELAVGWKWTPGARTALVSCFSACGYAPSAVHQLLSCVIVIVLGVVCDLQLVLNETRRKIEIYRAETTTGRLQHGTDSC